MIVEYVKLSGIIELFSIYFTSFHACYNYYHLTQTSIIELKVTSLGLIKFYFI